MKNIDPPTTASAIIRLAINDLTKVEKNKNYKIDMTEWHLKFENGPCYVCLAGSVMANTLKIDIDTYAGPAQGGRK